MKSGAESAIGYLASSQRHDGEKGDRPNQWTQNASFGALMNKLGVRRSKFDRLGSQALRTVENGEMKYSGGKPSRPRFFNSLGECRATLSNRIVERTQGVNESLVGTVWRKDSVVVWLTCCSLLRCLALSFI